VLTVSSAATRDATPKRILWGAYISGVQYGRVDAPWDAGTIARYTAQTKKRPSLIEWGQHWYECSTTCGMRPFRADLMQRVRDLGALPVLSWATDAEGEGLDQPDYRLSRIADGAHDAFLRDWARGAARWGHPFLLRMNWEMNTNSVSYSERSNGNAPGDFVRMWRHVHDVVEGAGATNVRWVWCPNVEYENSIKPLSSLYPGDTYVDWTCLDGYNWGTHSARPGSSWQSPEQVFRASYDVIQRLAPDKPMMIGETASTEVGGSKAAWIARLFKTLPRKFPAVRAVVWFNKAWDGMDWPIESSRHASRAFRSAIAAERYLGGRPGHAPDPDDP
jgi:hypothetical protein